MNLLLTCNTLPGQFAKIVANDETRLPHTLYFKGREMWVRMHGLMLRPFTDERIDELRSSGFTVELVQPELKTNEAIALFCRLYERHKGVKYTVTKKDAGMVAKLKVTEPVLLYYFDEESMPENSTTWLWRGKQSVPNLCRYYNEVRASMVAPAAPTGAKHPNQWSPEYFKKLDGAGITSYMQHLKSLGLVPKRGRDGSILEFVPHGTDQ
jgi:hypothetical protein